MGPSTCEAAREQSSCLRTAPKSTFGRVFRKRQSRMEKLVYRVRSHWTFVTPAKAGVQTAKVDAEQSLDTLDTGFRRYDGLANAQKR